MPNVSCGKIIIIQGWHRVCVKLPCGDILGGGSRERQQVQQLSCWLEFVGGSQDHSRMFYVQQGYVFERARDAGDMPAMCYGVDEPCGVPSLCDHM